MLTRPKMRPDRRERRRFLKTAAGVLTPTVSGLPACGMPGEDAERKSLAALLDTLIPADRDPGALQAGVLEVIVERIDNEPVTAARYRRLLAWIDQRSGQLYGRRFHLLTAAQRYDLLTDLYGVPGTAPAKLRVDLHVALDQCFHAFYSSPAAEAVIGYHPPIEGGYPDYARAPAPGG